MKNEPYLIFVPIVVGITVCIYFVLVNYFSSKPILLGLLLIILGNFINCNILSKKCKYPVIVFLLSWYLILWGSLFIFLTK